jgi:xylan 1,4-beta-xylosidase
VWNEPNIGFWVGRPAQATYFTLYDHTAKAHGSTQRQTRYHRSDTGVGGAGIALITHARRAIVASARQ